MRSLRECDFDLFPAEEPRNLGECGAVNAGAKGEVADRGAGVRLALADGRAF
jgi:hypothetical protein